MAEPTRSERGSSSLRIVATLSAIALLAGAVYYFVGKSGDPRESCASRGGTLVHIYGGRPLCLRKDAVVP